MSAAAIPRKKTSSATSSAKSSSSAPRTSPPPTCDVCMKKDGWRQNCLQRCRTCSLHVHDACYGMTPNQHKLPNFQCWACQAVGKSIEGRHMMTINRKGQRLRGFREEILQSTRPTECALCSVVSTARDKSRAMHPLYDAPLKKGRHLILPPTKLRPQPRLAWVHTICAFGVAGHRGTPGCVYACDEDGEYDDEHGNDDEDSNESSSEDKMTATHHFVMCGLDAVNDDADRDDGAWASALKQHRDELKCYLCGNTDNAAGVLRVPLQCCAGDQEEFEDFKKYHASLDGSCCQAMHVGCAHYGMGGKVPPFRQVWFYPGTAKADDGADYQDPVGQLFCTAHAKDMFPDGVRPGNTTKTALSRRTLLDHGSPGLLRREADSGALDPPPVHRTASIQAQIPRKKIALSRSKKTPRPRKKAPEHAVAVPRKRPPSSKPLVARAGPALKRRTSASKSTRASPGATNNESHREKRQQIDRTDSQDSLLGEEDARKNLDADYLETIIEDIIATVQTTLDRKTDDLVERVKARRKHWKRQKPLSKVAFKEYWKFMEVRVKARFPDVFGSVESEPQEAQGVLSADDPEETMEESMENPWAHLWIENAEPYDFGEWDTYEEVRLCAVPPRGASGR